MPAQPLRELVIYDLPLLRTDQQVGSAVTRVVDSGLPALPVLDADGRLRGLFGEREFIAAIFPGYLGELRSTGFLTEALDELVERRAQCGSDPVSRYMTTERVEVAPEHSAAHLAELFLHHPVVIVPVVDQGQVVGAVTRARFFAALVERLSAQP